MTTSTSRDELAALLVSTAQNFHSFGWHPGGAGSLSARLGAETLLMTAADGDKAALKEEDLLEAKPSKAPPIEAKLYELLGSEAGAILHLHHVDALLCADRDEKRGHTHFRDLAILNAFEVADEEPAMNAAVIPHSSSQKELLEKIAETLQAEKKEEEPPKAPCLNIADVGLFVWAPDLAEARRRAERLASLYSFSLRRPMSPRKAATVSGFQL